MISDSYILERLGKSLIERIGKKDKGIKAIKNK